MITESLKKKKANKIPRGAPRGIFAHFLIESILFLYHHSGTCRDGSVALLPPLVLYFFLRLEVFSCDFFLFVPTEPDCM